MYPDMVTDNYVFFSEITVKEVKLQRQVNQYTCKFWVNRLLVLPGMDFCRTTSMAKGTYAYTILLNRGCKNILINEN